ncbi:hypothetical protein HMPREF2822_02955 [Corynebacterium sp. HMSC062E11]|nr:hypothetical protein HMPREF2822_02955 [Corynebacterium sp. HMSC062E11]OFP69944.1 hypothetical protein HMPREF2974_04315 [Corynebacterium sp. HMSC078C09]
MDGDKHSSRAGRLLRVAHQTAGISRARTRGHREGSKHPTVHRAGREAHRRLVLSPLRLQTRGKHRMAAQLMASVSKARCDRAQHNHMQDSATVLRPRGIRTNASLASKA